MKFIEIAPGVHAVSTRGVNVYLVESKKNLALIDAGWPGDYSDILHAANQVFGSKKPHGIYLTHAHPDHMGAALQLARHWMVPVFMHEHEIPVAQSDFEYIARYPIPIDRFFILPFLRLMGEARRKAIVEKGSLGNLATALPQTPVFTLKEIPGLVDWKYIHTPGHTVGHVAFFRQSDRVLISGDAILTAGCGGLLGFYKTATLPLRMASWDWPRTKESARVLIKLNPDILASGHGQCLKGNLLQEVLGKLRRKLV